MKIDHSNMYSKLSEMSVEKFMECGFDSDSDGDVKKGTRKDTSDKSKKRHSKKRLSEMSVNDFMESGLNSDPEDDPEDSMEDPREPEGTLQTSKKAKKTNKMTQSMDKLKDTDPEFYEFLAKEDKSLLEFELSDGDSEDQESEDEDYMIESSDDGKEDEGTHTFSQKLEVASDDSEEEDDENIHKRKKSLVTMTMVNKWSGQLQDLNPMKGLHSAVSAFQAAVRQAGGGDKQETEYNVEGSTVFNAVVRMCLKDILPAVRAFLNLRPQKNVGKQQLPSSSKKWIKMRPDMKAYLTSLIQLLGAMSEPAILNVILKHIHELVTFYACFPKIYKLLVKKLITVWSAGEENSRVVAFMSIFKLVRMMQKSLLEPCMKQMYMAYVKNCKFTSPNTLPLINFMQQSLVELFSVDFNLTYQYAFVYIRQLAIHLRNATTVKKKDTIQAVYNWQYIHCLFLWVRLLCSSHPNDTLHPLIFPLTQTIIGCLRLVPVAKYYPLRFQCVRALNMLSAGTHTFIPVLPFLLNVFELTDFNKRHHGISLKPFNFACMLKLSKSQLNDKSFRDGTIDQLYEHFLEHFNIHAHSVGFPELALPSVMQIKAFLKNCKVANYCKQIKQILDKVEENSQLVTKKRRATSFDIRESKLVDALETRIKQEGTPLGTYYTKWRKLRDRELQHAISEKDSITADDRIPAIQRRRHEAPLATDEDRKEFAELFESGSEDSDDDTQRFLLKSERTFDNVGKHRLDEDDNSSAYSDFDENELEQLAGSGDSDSIDVQCNDSVKKCAKKNWRAVRQQKERKVERKVGKTGDISDSNDGEDVLEDFHFTSSEEEDDQAK